MCGHHDAVASHDDKLATVLTALRKELLFSAAVVVDLFEIRQPMSAAASDD